MDILLYILAGATVGFLVGLTGVGGGSLMTPLLLLFGYPPAIAIGTDLVYAAVTKAGGVLSHHRQRTIHWDIVFRLGLGSIPASLITTFLLSNYFTHSDEYKHLLLSTLGVMLILTSAIIISKKRIIALLNTTNRTSGFSVHNTPQITVLMGAILGVCVTLSSVGAGAFGAAILMVLYPRLDAVKIIGTDIAHAVPLTLVAGLGHMHLGNVDYMLLLALLVGSLPAIHLGTKLSKRLPEKVLQPTLASVLLIIGVKYAFF